MDDFFKEIDGMENLVIEIQKGLTAIPAINPENGGDGEYEKFLFLRKLIGSWGFDSLEEFLVPDDRVKSKMRPSLIATINGKVEQKLWIITHLDVVPPGEEALWDNSPYNAVVKNGRIYGRGVEDNQQSLVSSLLAAKTILDNKIKPHYTVKLFFIADEEVGSDKGIKWFLENNNFFSKDDLIMTPDGGEPSGKTIEIAEKSILWIMFKVLGKQSHGSRPDKGINSQRAASHLCIRLDDMLHAKYNGTDPVYDIPVSTFEPTRRYNNVANMNTIPGEEHLGFDCRILPCYRLSDVIDDIDVVSKEIEKQSGVKIETDIIQNLQAPAPTPPDAGIVRLIQKSVNKLRGFIPQPIGIGGGTVAAYLRMKGYHAALWSTIDMTMHSPNEYSIIKNTMDDAKVFLDMMMGE